MSPVNNQFKSYGEIRLSEMKTATPPELAEEIAAYTVYGQMKTPRAASNKSLKMRRR